MGVKGLQFFLERCCSSASPDVDIAQLVLDRKRRLGSDEELVIVVDGNSCIRQLYDDLEWIGGGQLKQFGEKAQQFVEAFKALGVRLVFFFDGPTVKEKRNTWVERRLSKVDSMYSVLDDITRGVPSSSINRRHHFILPPGLGQLSRIIFQTICGCEVYQSSLQECDEEIAEYARENQVFAVLTQDSDFVILDLGEAHYLSTLHLNVTCMTTKLYDGVELARCLRIHPYQLPLLATIMGNDVVTAAELKPFHVQITGQTNPERNIDFQLLVPNIAAFIRSLPQAQDPNYLRNPRLMSLIANRVLGDQSRHMQIKSSLDSYNTGQGRSNRRGTERRSDHWSQLVAEARERHVYNEFPSMVFAIMSGLPFESSTSIEDFRKDDIPSFASATQQIRQRIYGILLQEKPLKRGYHTHLVEEWCMAGPDSLNEAHILEAVFPQPRHPGLMVLWNDSERIHLTLRWELFVHSVSTSLDVNRLRCPFHPHMVVPTLILYYINENYGCFYEWEIDVMLATAASLKKYDVSMLEAIPPDPMSSRGIRVANLIMRMTFIMYFLLAACGYPLNVEQTAVWNFFDGKLFQRKYKQAESSVANRTPAVLCEHRVDVLEKFNSARQIVFN